MPHTINARRHTHHQRGMSTTPGGGASSPGGGGGVCAAWGGARTVTHPRPAASAATASAQPSRAGAHANLRRPQPPTRSRPQNRALTAVTCGTAARRGGVDRSRRRRSDRDAAGGGRRGGARRGCPTGSHDAHSSWCGHLQLACKRSWIGFSGPGQSRCNRADGREVHCRAHTGAHAIFHSVEQ